ncbi:BT4734/BF3469 family protein, partial [Flavobacterium hercynium]
NELKNIKTGIFQDQILNCRKAYNQGEKDIYIKLKSQLPSVTFSGVFKNGRKIQNLEIYNNLMVIDIDKIAKNEIIILKKKLSADKYILALWISPSGFGLKGLIKIDSNINLHKEIFNHLNQYFIDQYNIEIDKSGSDITRLCFSSWDPEIHYNSKSITFQKQLFKNSTEKTNPENIKKHLLTFPIPSYEIDLKEDISLIKDIISFLNKKNVSITHNYLSWRNVALAISSSFSYEIGKDFFLQICRLDNEAHNELKSITLLDNCYKTSSCHSGQKLTIKTVFYFAKEVGYKKSLKHLL